MTWKALPVGQVAPVGGFVMQGCTWDFFGIDGPVYLSIDLDVLDPAFAPGVSHHEPGGMSVRDVLHIIQNFGGQLIGGDLVELNPERDLNGVTAMVAAKILREMMARCLADHAAEDGATVDGAGG